MHLFHILLSITLLIIPTFAHRTHEPARGDSTTPCPGTSSRGTYSFITGKILDILHIRSTDSPNCEHDTSRRDTSTIQGIEYGAYGGYGGYGAYDDTTPSNTVVASPLAPVPESSSTNLDGSVAKPTTAESSMVSLSPSLSVLGPVSFTLTTSTTTDPTGAASATDVIVPSTTTEGANTTSTATMTVATTEGGTDTATATPTSGVGRELPLFGYAEYAGLATGMTLVWATLVGVW